MRSSSVCRRLLGAEKAVVEDVRFEGEDLVVAVRANLYHGRRALLLKIIPDCPSQPANGGAAAHCPPSRLRPAPVGEHIAAWGPWVSDLDYGSWRELHPLERWQRI